MERYLYNIIHVSKAPFDEKFDALKKLIKLQGNLTTHWFFRKKKP